MRVCLEHLDLVAEPSGAVAMSAVLCGRVAVDGGRIGVVLSGGNVDPERFEELVGLRVPAHADEGRDSGAPP
jgi:threonine dehydratase